MKFIHLLLCSVFTFFVLYGPQPILPELAEVFSLTSYQAGLLMTATMLPLAIAPLVFGYLLLRVNAIRLLKMTLAMLSVTCLLLPLATSFEQLLVIRLMQGVLLPAALTAMTSYIGQHYRYNYLAKALTSYILSTIAGGFLARVTSATISEYANWQLYFFLLSLVLAGLAVSLRNVKSRTTKTTQATPPALKENISKVFQGRTFMLYLPVFGMFFCFTALLNYLPFILKNEFQFESARDIGLVYAGYLLGALFSVLTPKLQLMCRGKSNLLLLTFIIYNVSIVSLITNNFTLFFIGFSVFCAAMFIIHASASALLNQISHAPTSLTNGFYVSFYYSGGTLGSFAPGIIYQYFGKEAFILSLLCLCILSTLSIAYFKRTQVD